MKAFFVDVLFRQIAHLSPEKVRQAATLAADNGLQLYYTTKFDPVLRQDLDQAITTVKFLRHGPNEWAVSFRASPASVPHRNSSFSFDQFDPSKNQFRMGGLLDFEFKDERPLIAPYAHEMLRLAELLYPVIQPRLGWIDNSDYCDPDFKDIDKLRLPCIGWVTFFSPAYVAKYGERLLAGIPAYRTQALPDGGLLVQLTLSLLAASKDEARQAQSRVKAYFQKHGLKVKCHAPYFIEGALPQAEAAPPSELQTYLRQVVGTTFVLDNNTRLKVIHIPWAEVGEAERDTALTTIRAMLAEEISAHPKAQFKFELNEIPPELERILKELAGRHKAGVEWTQVDA